MKVKPLREIIHKIRNLNIASNIDLVVGIGRGGTVPAYLIASHLNLPLEFIWLNFRDERHEPRFPVPKLLRPIHFECRGKRILLVDDRSRSGATLVAAKDILRNASLIQTLVVNGRADYSIFNEECFAMPWEMSEKIN